MSTTTELSKTEPVIVMTRLYDAPRDTVWEASTNAEHVRRWWGGKGCTNPVCEMDVRPGGRWHHVMVFANGQRIVLDFIFLDVERPKRLVWQHDEAKLPPGAPLIHTTVTLEEVDGKTRWRMVARFRSMADRESAVSWGFSNPIAASNDAFAAYLQTL